MYWAWKNLKADYYGLFHYRRAIDFTPQNAIVRAFKFFIPQCFWRMKYHLQAQHIYDILQTHKPDIIIPNRQNLAPHLSLYDTYKQSHYIQDLEEAIAFIRANYPAMQDAVNEALFSKGRGVCYWNIGIWRKDLFFEYCEWLFSVLFGIMEQIPYKQYDDFQKRVFGFLGERLFNVWLIYKMKTSNLKILEYKTRLLYETNRKIFGVVSSKECKRYYFLFIRVYKKRILPPPHLQDKTDNERIGK